jgi:outer membrane protein TolC
MSGNTSQRDLGRDFADLLNHCPDATTLRVFSRPTPNEIPDPCAEIDIRLAGFLRDSFRRNPMRIPTHTAARVLLILLTATLSASADTGMDEPENSGGGSEMIQLSLREAVTLAIENNLGVEVARHAPLIAERDTRIAWSAYDPTLSGDVSYSNKSSQSTGSQPDNIDNIFRSNALETQGTAKIGGLVPWVGATLSLDYSGSNSKSFFTNRATRYESGLAFTASVPLLKGLVWNEPWTQIKIAHVLHSSSLEDFRVVLMDTVRDTIAAYWTLVAQAEQLRVAKKSLDTGRALLAQTQTQYEVGVKAKVEVIQAEAGVAARELDVIKADALFQNSQDNLIDTVYGVRLTPGAIVELNLTDNPLDFDDYTVDRDLSTDLAMKNRPELESLELDIERRETLVRFRKNQRLPQLDLNLTYGSSGFNPSGAGNGRFEETHNRWFTNRGTEEYSVGGMFSIPIGNSGARHNVTKARLELRRAKTQLIQLHQRIIVEIRRDIRLLEAALKGIDASERQRIAAEEQLRAERIRLEHGESTPFDVLLKESELVEAEVEKISALQLYRTSVSDLDRAQGTILRTHNIVVGSTSGLRNGFERESFSMEKLLEPVLP